MVKDTMKRRRSPDKNRYFVSKATLKEFNLKESEIPVHMREDSDERRNLTDHVDENIRGIKTYNSNNK